MEPKSGTIARALVDLIEGANAALAGVAVELADWSGFSAAACYYLVLISTPAMMVMSWKLMEAILAGRGRKRRRRRR